MLTDELIRFRPWVPGTSDPRVAGVRLLVLGESHYEEGDEASWTPEDFKGLTQLVVKRWGREPKGYRRFFANVFALLTGRPWSLDEAHADLWENILFYNYVQTLVPGGPGHRPSAHMWRDSEAAYSLVLEQLRPEAVLVLGKELWDNMLAAEMVDDVESALGKVFAYCLSDGSSVYAAHVHHPSTRGFKPLMLADRVVRFLDWVKIGRNDDARVT